MLRRAPMKTFPLLAVSMFGLVSVVGCATETGADVASSEEQLCTAPPLWRSAVMRTDEAIASADSAVVHATGCATFVMDRNAARSPIRFDFPEDSYGASLTTLATPAATLRALEHVLSESPFDIVYLTEPTEDAAQIPFAFVRRAIFPRPSIRMTSIAVPAGMVITKELAAGNEVRLSGAATREEGDRVCLTVDNAQVCAEVAFGDRPFFVARMLQKNLPADLGGIVVRTDEDIDAPVTLRIHRHAGACGRPVSLGGTVVDARTVEDVCR